MFQFQKLGEGRFFPSPPSPSLWSLLSSLSSPWHRLPHTHTGGEDRLEHCHQCRPEHRGFRADVRGLDQHSGQHQQEPALHSAGFGSTEPECPGTFQKPFELFWVGTPQDPNDFFRAGKQRVGGVWKIELMTFLY